MTLYPTKVGGYVAGDNTVTIHGLWAEYDSKASGVEELTSKDSEFEVYPNPVTDGRVTIQAPGQDNVAVSIYNVSGSLVYNDSIVLAGGNASLVVSLPSGLYYIKLQGDKVSAVKKIIIK